MLDEYVKLLAVVVKLNIWYNTEIKITPMPESHTYHRLKSLHEETPSSTKSALFALLKKEPEIIPAGVANPISGRVSSFVRQAIATLLIFGLFFVVVNWSAVVQIVSWEYQKFTQQTDTNNDLYRLLEKKNVKEDPLPLSRNADEAKRMIPSLGLAIAPPDTRLVIPRINRNVPVVNVSTESLIKKDWNQLEKDMQEALRGGVIHYPGTARPGQQGNIVVTGHSSYFPWDPGRFKDVFAVLHDMKVGDQVLLYNNQKRYIYEVTGMKKVWPSELEVLKPSSENKLTLITCTPIGTNLKRLIVEAKLVRVES